jgi:hypothetical protein
VRSGASVPRRCRSTYVGKYFFRPRWGSHRRHAGPLVQLPVLLLACPVAVPRAVALRAAHLGAIGLAVEAGVAEQGWVSVSAAFFPPFFLPWPLLIALIASRVAMMPQPAINIYSPHASAPKGHFRTQGTTNA